MRIQKRYVSAGESGEMASYGCGMWKDDVQNEFEPR